MSKYNQIKALIDNEIKLESDERFTAIIGSTPSKGARSPKLWNQAFLHYGLPIRMYPLDVSPSNLPILIEQLSQMPTFLGGAIAVPHKNAVASLLDKSISKESQRIGAVNCLYRDRLGRLSATNTDGEASLISLKNCLGNIHEKRILILGCGGAAKAVSAYMVSAVGPAGKVILACRNTTKANLLKDRLGLSLILEWGRIPSLLDSVDVIINCTTLGSNDHINLSPLAATELSTLKNSVFIYDIIYQPSPTLLIRNSTEMGLQTLDGLSMNLEQAVLAFMYTMKTHIKHLDCDTVRECMLQI